MSLENRVESVTVSGTVWIELLTEIRFAQQRLERRGTEISELLYGKKKGSRFKDKSRKELREILQNIGWCVTGAAGGLRGIGENKAGRP